MRYNVIPSRSDIQPAVLAYLVVVCVCLFLFGHDLAYSANFGAIQDQSGAGVAELVEEGSPLRRFALLSMSAASLLSLFLARRRPSLKPLVAANLPYLVFLLLGLASLAWASDPGLAFRRSSEFLLFSITALTLARLLSLPQLLTFACVSSFTYLTIGMLAEFALRTFQPTSNDYRFCGTLHPNHQAWQCGLLVLSASALFLEANGRRKLFFAVAAVIGMLFLLLTKSRTTLGAVVLALFLLVGFALTGKRLLRILGVLALALAAFSFVGIILQSSLAALYESQLAGRGEDSITTLTGRLPLWTLAFQFIGERPLTGYGFYAFWTPDHIRYFSDQLGWGVPESHNGFIELLLSLGIPGLLLYLALLIRSSYIFARSALRSPQPRLAFPCALFLFFLLVMFCDVIALDINVVTLLVFTFVWKSGSLGSFQERSSPSHDFALRKTSSARPLPGVAVARSQWLEQP